MNILLCALKGAGFSAALAVLVFFLKIICPIQAGCLVDPFLLVLFAPLQIGTALGLFTHLSPSTEPFFVLGFWTIFGGLVGLAVELIRERIGPLNAQTEENEEESEEKNEN